MKLFYSCNNDERNNLNDANDNNGNKRTISGSFKSLC